jgi:membrane protein YqaA with SNARE-associated domain
MRLFGPIYERCLAWAGHRHAERYLAVISTAESVVFPIPPDVMLGPMVLAKPERWFRYALICTLASVFGGVLGYLLGAYALDAVMPWIERTGKRETFDYIHTLFETYGFWIVFVAGFTPIPYKVFTIASGAAGMAWLPFLLGSFVGRGGRFFLVALLIRLGGARLEGSLRRYVEWIGWGVLVLVAIGLAVWEFTR